MLARSTPRAVRFQPWVMSVQTRFKWRHKETDRWRRLMDATCFAVDWIGSTIGPNFGPAGGHWSHILTPAHVICPWDYPNYYPPTGPTRYVSRITLGDTQVQVRARSLQGGPFQKHFTSNQHVFVHNNPRLDLCAIHAEQNFRRQGEMKMMMLQADGVVIRPRLELNEELREGDTVWIYGMTAHDSLFDEEAQAEPIMVPTGVRGRVKHRTREHFFVETIGVEDGDPQSGRVQMGMCGAAVMRNGRCVGMLTATVHEESNSRELAGTAMCTYASDIFDFLLEVERQMKTRPPPADTELTTFERRRNEELAAAKEAGAQLTKDQRVREATEPRDWSLDHTRAARRVYAPISLFHLDENYMTEESAATGAFFGPTGVFNQENQESSLGLDMNESIGREHGGNVAAPRGTGMVTEQNRNKLNPNSRVDTSPPNVYLKDTFVPSDTPDYQSRADVADIARKSSATDSPDDVDMVEALKRSAETIRQRRAEERAAGQAFAMGASSTAASGFAQKQESSETSEGSIKAGSQAHSRAARDVAPEGAAAAAIRAHERAAAADVSMGKLGNREQREVFQDVAKDIAGARRRVAERAAKKEEAERRYQEQLRKRHEHKPRPFGADDDEDPLMRGN